MRPPTGFRDKLSTAPSGNPVATLNSKDMIPLTKAEEKKEAKRVEAQRKEKEAKMAKESREAERKGHSPQKNKKNSHHNKVSPHYLSNILIANLLIF